MGTTSLDGDATFDRNSTTFDVIGTSQTVTLSNLNTAIDVGHYVTDSTPTGIPTGWTFRTLVTITGTQSYRKQVITNLNSGQTYYGKTMSRISNNATTSLTWSDWRMVGDVEYPPRVKTDGSTVTLNINALITDQFNVTAQGSNLTIASPTNPTDGQKLTIRIKDNGTTRTLTWDPTTSVFRAIGTTLPLLTTANKTIYVGCIYNSDDTKWDVVAVSEEA